MLKCQFCYSGVCNKTGIKCWYFLAEIPQNECSDFVEDRYEEDKNTDKDLHPDHPDSR